jgi:hypothetical protein
MAEPEIKASHLAYATAPRAQSAEEVLLQLETVEQRLSLREIFASGWKLRRPPRASAPADPSLQDLVQAARERLRDDRVTADTVELGSRKLAVGLVKQGLRS